MRVLYDYFRSSAAYRVRIALNLKGLNYDSVPVPLLENAQRAEPYLAKNPQGLVPALQDGDALLTQSLAICEYLDETYPEPALLPRDAYARWRSAWRATFTRSIICACCVSLNRSLVRIKRKKTHGTRTG